MVVWFGHGFLLYWDKHFLFISVVLGLLSDIQSRGFPLHCRLVEQQGLNAVTLVTMNSASKQQQQQHSCAVSAVNTSIASFLLIETQTKIRIP